MNEIVRSIMTGQEVPSVAEKLRKPQIRILKALAHARGSMTRTDISEVAEVDIAWIGDHVGRTDTAAREARDEVTGYKSLVSLGLVSIRQGDDVDMYKITKEGREVARSL